MIVEAKEHLSGQNVKLALEDALISGELKRRLHSDEVFCAPGFIDLQINGYKGVDFNGDDLSNEKIGFAVVELLKDGVSGFLPTLITNEPQLTDKNLRLLTEAMEKNELVRNSILGFHMEGPFISEIDGARGAHPVEWIRKPDFSLVEHWQKISGNRIKLITLSPEHKGSITFIKACRNIGIKIAIGHSNASSGQVVEAVDAGATLSTHLGNAMPQHIHRHHNILFDQIANDGLYASIVADGHHLPVELVRIIERSKQDKLFIISDATRFTGMPPGIYRSNIGGKVELKENMRLSIFGNEEYLAGGASSMAECVNVLIERNQIPAVKAWEMASNIPFSFLNDGIPPKEERKETVLFSMKEGRIDILVTVMNDLLFSHYI